MSDRLRFILIIGLIVVVGGGGFLGFQYFSQRSQLNEGIELLEENDNQKAYECFHEASGKISLIWTNQKNDAHYYEAEALYKLEKFQQAINVYDEIIDKTDESRAYGLKALCYIGLNDDSQALAVCDEGIAASPDEGYSYDVKASILSKQEKYDQALEVINKALDADVSDGRSDVLFARISLYEAKFDYASALKYAKEYVKEYPDDEKGQKELTFLQTR